MLDIQCAILFAVSAIAALVWSILVYNVFQYWYNDYDSIWRYHTIKSFIDFIHNNCINTLYIRICLYPELNITDINVGPSIKILAFKQFINSIKLDEKQFNKTKNTK